jgi:hypothetical protein
MLELLVSDPVTVAGYGVVNARVSEEISKAKAKKELKRIEERNIG